VRVLLRLARIWKYTSLLFCSGVAVRMHVVDEVTEHARLRTLVEPYRTIKFLLGRLQWWHLTQPKGYEQRS
jgi:hypothetical protein